MYCLLKIMRPPNVIGICVRGAHSYVDVLVLWKFKELRYQLTKTISLRIFGEIFINFICNIWTNEKLSGCVLWRIPMIRRNFIDAQNIVWYNIIKKKILLHFSTESER